MRSLLLLLASALVVPTAQATEQYAVSVGWSNKHETRGGLCNQGTIDDFNKQLGASLNEVLVEQGFDAVNWSSKSSFPTRKLRGNNQDERELSYYLDWIHGDLKYGRRRKLQGGKADTDVLAAALTKTCDKVLKIYKSPGYCSGVINNAVCEAFVTPN